MFQKVINFIKKSLRFAQPVKMENLSTLAPEPLALNLLPTLDLGLTPINFTSITIEAYLYNSTQNLLEKVKISLQEDIQDIIQVTPWGMVTMNSEYQLIQINFLPENCFLMNTENFPLKFFKNGEDFRFQPQDLSPGLVLLPQTVVAVVETLKQKNVTYPIITSEYLDRNKSYFNEDQLNLLFQSVCSTPVESLMDSLNVLDQQLTPIIQRIYGHRWNLNAEKYYSESKLAALDRTDLSVYDFWMDQYPLWQMGQVGIIKLTTGFKMLVEVVSVGEDHLWVVDRQLAVKLLLAGENKEQCLLKCQNKLLLSEISHFFIANN